VTTCSALTKSNCTAALRKDIGDARQSQRRLSLATAGVVARVARNRRVAAELAPMKVRGKIGTSLHMTARVQMHRADARSTRLFHLTADIPRHLLQVVIGVGDHAAMAPFKGQELRDQFTDF